MGKTIRNADTEQFQIGTVNIQEEHQTCVIGTVF